MKTYQEFCEPRTKQIGAPVEIVSPTMTKWANEYGDYAKNDGKEQVAATMYQVLGSVESSAMSDGQWKRCMDWLSSMANGIDAGELLPVYSLDGEQYLNSRDLQINMKGLALEKELRIKKLEYAAKAVIRRGLIHSYMDDDEFEAVIVDLQNVLEDGQ